MPPLRRCAIAVSKPHYFYCVASVTKQYNLVLAKAERQRVIRHNTGSVFMYLTLKLVPGWRLKKLRSAPAVGPLTLDFYMIISQVQHCATYSVFVNIYDVFVQPTRRFVVGVESAFLSMLTAYMLAVSSVSIIGAKRGKNAVSTSKPFVMFFVDWKLDGPH